MGVRDNVKMQEYINKVCSQIRFRDIHKDIGLELKTHLEELTEEYAKDGLAEIDAVNKAIAQMGSAETVGKELNRIHRPQPDWSILALSFLLITTGLTAMYFLENYSSTAFPIFARSLFYVLIGGGALTVLYFFDYRKMEKHSFKIYGITLLIITGSFLFGHRVSGQYFLLVGPFSLNLISISPIFFTLALSGIFHNWDWNQLKKLFLGLLIAIVPFIFLLNGSLSAAVIYAVACIILMITSGARPKILLLLTGMITLCLTWLIISTPYRMSRLKTFINPDQDPLGSGYLQNQLSQIISNSGLLGVGRATAPKIPELHTDFIFSYITYTFGWIAGGCLAVLVILFIFRITRIASLVKDHYARMLMMGLSAIFIVQFVWNILMNLGLAPISGVGLPFVSFGGTQLVFHGVVLGIISSIYKRRNITPFQPLP